MHTSRRIIAAAATAVLAVAAPAAAHKQEPAPPIDQPVEVPGPPPSTHGAFLPVPEEFFAPQTVPLCDSEITVTTEAVEPAMYRALVTEDGDTVVDYRGVLSVDVTRASDGATLEDVIFDSTPIETYAADGLSATFDYPGPAMVISLDEPEAQAYEEAGLPPAFVYLSGRVVVTVTVDSASGTEQAPPAVTDVEIVENSAEYVFDVCHLLDQAAAQEAPAP